MERRRPTARLREAQQMDGSEIAVLAALGAGVCAFLVSLVVGGPTYRRTVGRIATTAFLIRCWPFERDPLRVEREYRASWERQAQDLAGRISALIRRLRRRGGLSDGEAERHSRLVADAVKQVWEVEEDARELARTEASRETAERVKALARQTVDDLERLHTGLAELLAATIAGGSAPVGERLREAGEELGATVVALREVGGVAERPEEEGEPPVAEQQVEMEG